MIEFGPISRALFLVVVFLVVVIDEICSFSFFFLGV